MKREEQYILGKIQTYKNMPALVAEALKEKIMRGEYKGGTPLKQDEIAKQFDVSLIPVREALIQLEAMHLVKSIRNKGAVVTTLSIKEMHQLFQLRKVLEVGNVILMKGPVAKETLHKMHLIVEKIKNTEDSYSLSRYNKLFYELLCSCGNNEELNDSYAHLFVRIERYLNYIFYCLPHYIEANDHYVLVVELLEKQQFKELKNVLKKRIEDVEETFLMYLQSQYASVEALDWNNLLPFEQKNS